MRWCSPANTSHFLRFLCNQTAYPTWALPQPPASHLPSPSFPSANVFTVSARIQKQSEGEVPHASTHIEQPYGLLSLCVPPLEPSSLTWTRISLHQSSLLSCMLSFFSTESFPFAHKHNDLSHLKHKTFSHILLRLLSIPLYGTIYSLCDSKHFERAKFSVLSSLTSRPQNWSLFTRTVLVKISKLPKAGHVFILSFSDLSSALT